MSESQPGMVHEDFISSQDPNNQTDNKKTKSRRPASADTAFRQQRLKAWQPILTPKTVLPLFFAIGIIFAPIGGVLLWASSQVQEIILDYSKCFSDAPIYPSTAAMNSGDVTMNFQKNSNTVRSDSPSWSRRAVNITYFAGTDTVQPVIVNTTRCTINFTIPNEMKPPVLFYYKLTNFYQNHRRYAKSFSTDQLSGKAVSASSIDGSDCTPLTVETINGTKKPYYPCGLAANSVFNDTFYSPVLLNVPGSNTDNETYEMAQTGISWKSDRELYEETKYNWDDVLVPPNWIERYPNGYSDAWHPKLKEDEPFQVWMRLAGLPTFSKLAQRNDSAIMKAGTYTVDIDHHFNVTEYGGTKSIIISTRTVMGGKNPFLGIAYVVVGGICIVLGTLFTVTHLIKPRKLGDHTYLSWNNEQSTATTSGRDGGMGNGEGHS
ncbi:hypothetical protein QTJ16_005293 [Diplocarpon rosae]|uniref:Lem3/Cdc50 n=1 Tax=Diplocarpon rosae TaxID=946125 RepID=A0AAD9SXW1_9HELO|nr:hypothetical protein QTJ16_005293 [Diplocarpon rosae]